MMNVVILLPTGGSFPVSFSGPSLTSREVRQSVTAVTDFSASTTLSTMLEVVHRGVVRRPPHPRSLA